MIRVSLPADSDDIAGVTCVVLVLHIAMASKRSRILQCPCQPSQWWSMLAGGQWLPEMVDLAGGCDSAQEAGAPSMPLSWDQVLSNPETIPLLWYRKRTVSPHNAPACMQVTPCRRLQHRLDEHTALITFAWA